METNPNSEATPSTQEDEVEKVFKKFDANGDGKISSTELGAILNGLGSTATADEVSRIMSELDTDGDGYVDLSEFKAFHRGGGDNKELKEAFDLYDKDKNGKISASELHAVLRSLGEKCSIKDCERMISSFDVDEDGCINFEEFKKMMPGAS
ncbi:Calmodulin and related proteins (EF-Hand superfamily) [Handroanthus impetiginosus]|uniref:Calmodulin and related proteins (EF-Hand superfamily) n=1 Tax=Handroanthus impetiginosus TaxID=429701 RepID=A0A2G9HQD7_9LAMI|nr:Calmodulin and related proteins (EF-Hand superfamily) [Handroanthus impetiginosus]